MPEIDNLLGSTRRVVEETEPLNNCRGVTYRVLNVGGGGIDEKRVIIKSSTIPAAGEEEHRNMYIYAGETDANYTHGYIYECVGSSVASSASASQTVGSGLTDITVDKETLEQFTGWTTDNSLQIFYTPDGWSVDAASLGVSYTGTPVEGDAITIVYTAPVTTYAWVRLNTQPVPTAEEIGAVTQETRTISLVSTDWSSHSQTKTVSGVTADNTVIVAPVASSASDYAAAEILCTAQATNSLTFTCTTDPANNISVNVVILNS